MNLALLTVAAEGETTPGWPDKLPLLPQPMEMVIGLIAFAVLYWLYAKFVVPSMERMYEQRRDAIEGDMSRADNALREAEETKRQYQAALTDARTEAARIREEAREQGAQIVAEMRTQAQDESARILESGQRQLQVERGQAMASLRSDVGRISTDLASRIVGESLHDEARQKGIVERFLSDLESDNVPRESIRTASTTSTASTSGATASPVVQRESGVEG